MSRRGDSFLSLLKLPLSLKSLDTAFKSLFWLVSYLVSIVFDRWQRINEKSYIQIE